MQLLVNPLFKEDLDERLVGHVPLVGDSAELFQHVFGQAQGDGSGGGLQFELFGPQPDDIPHNPDQAPDTQEYGSQSKVATFQLHTCQVQGNTGKCIGHKPEQS